MSINTSTRADNEVLFRRHKSGTLDPTRTAGRFAGGKEISLSHLRSRAVGLLVSRGHGVPWPEYPPP